MSSLVAKHATVDYPVRWETPSVSGEHEDLRSVYFGDDSWNERNVVKSSVGGTHMPRRFLDLAERIYNFEVRPTDIWVVTYPKCGTTVVQEMLWQMVNGVDSAACNFHLYSRAPFLEFQALNLHEFDLSSFPGRMQHAVIRESVHYAETLKGRRVIKTHLPFELLPPNLLKTAKVVYVCRNPRDACVSYYHHQRLWDEGYRFKGSFEDFAKLFRKGILSYGSYWSHLKSAWRNRFHPNLKIVWYEDLKCDLGSFMSSLGEFVDASLSESKAEELRQMLGLDRFRELHAAGAGPDEFERGRLAKFVRKGKVGDWRNAFDECSGEEVDRWEAWIERNAEDFDGLDIQYEAETGCYSTTGKTSNCSRDRNGLREIES